MQPAKGPNKCCWTCRLRHKKCDDNLPSCTTCERLGIFCYGSGNKPEFMDGGEKQKQKSAEIGALVKAKNDSLRRMRALEARRRSTQNVTRSPHNATIPNGSLLPDADTVQRASYTGLGLSVTPNMDSNPSISRTQTPAARCEFWVKSIIEETRNLIIRKESLSSEVGEAESPQSKADRLWNRLKNGLKDGYQRDARLAEMTPNSTNNPQSHPDRMDLWITNAFAHAAFIYILITLHGKDARDLPATRKLVFDWIFYFRFLPEQRFLPILVWPLCIAGCVASNPTSQSFFRDTVILSGIDQKSPCSIWNALQIMEKCWDTSTERGFKPGDAEWIKELDLLRERIYFNTT